MAERTEIVLRLACFATCLLGMLAWERCAPHRGSTVRPIPRRIANLACVALGAMLSRLVVPLGTVMAALLAESRDWGLLQRVDWPPPVEITLAVLLFDLAVYAQHVAFHTVPVLWRLHRVHHADLDVDATTGVRFHPLEFALSAVIRVALVLTAGPSAASVVTFEVLLNATSLFNHGDVRMPARLDRVLRAVVVTPDMHRIHHSVEPAETNSNFGFGLPWWDRLFGTYRPEPRAARDGMVLGLADRRDEREVDRLPGMLLLPFRTDAGRGASGEPGDAQNRHVGP